MTHCPALHDFPSQHVVLLQELATRLIDSRKPGTDLASLARDLLGGFHDLCMRLGLDGLLAALAQTFPPLEVASPGSAGARSTPEGSAESINDRGALADHPVMHPGLVAQLSAIDLDGGGPRGAKPKQISDSVIAALQLVVADEADRMISLPGTARAEAVAGIASALESDLAVPRIKETIIEKGRAACEERYHSAFDKLAKNLDDRGMRIDKIPKVPIDALHAVQQVLIDTRNAVIGGMVRTAIDRAKAAIEKANPDAAARIDAPITHRLTPRDVAVLRACDPQLPKIPSAVAISVLDSLTETARLIWLAAEKPVRSYGASQSFAVGEVIEHPKFGRGEVVAAAAQRFDVEFESGKMTLVHVRK